MEQNGIDYKELFPNGPFLSNENTVNVDYVLGFSHIPPPYNSIFMFISQTLVVKGKVITIFYNLYHSV